VLVAGQCRSGDDAAVSRPAFLGFRAHADAEAVESEQAVEAWLGERHRHDGNQKQRSLTLCRVAARLQQSLGCQVFVDLHGEAAHAIRVPAG
jgi:hypothetical protein